MDIDKSIGNQDYRNACIGGLLIATACSLNFCVLGRITGMSGFINGGIFNSDLNSYWKLSSLFTIFITSSLAYLTDGRKFFPTAYDQQENLPLLGFIIGGILVGVGSKVANGCTSGHGICGSARLSKRSFTAIICFIIGGVIMNEIKRNFSQLNQDSNLDTLKENNAVMITLCVSALGFLINLYRQYNNLGGQLLETLLSSLCAAIFTFGLIISGAIDRRNIYGFLNIFHNFNPTLIYILGCAILPTLLFFQLIIKKGSPLWVSTFDAPKVTDIDAKLVVGALIFGLGWGLAGLCPGTTYVLVPMLVPEVAFIFFPSIILTHWCIKKFEETK